MCSLTMHVHAHTTAEGILSYISLQPVWSCTIVDHCNSHKQGSKGNIIPTQRNHTVITHMANVSLREIVSD